MSNNYEELQAEKADESNSNPQKKWWLPWMNSAAEFAFSLREKFNDENISILEIGCGDGTGMMIFKSLRFDNIRGIDLSPIGLQEAKRKGLNVSRENAHFLPFADKSFDAVFSAHTFEHLENPALAFMELDRVCKKNAKILIIVPFPDGSDDGTVHCGSRILGTKFSTEKEFQNQLDSNFPILRELIKNSSDLTVKNITPFIEQYPRFREAELWISLEKLI